MKVKHICISAVRKNRTGLIWAAIILLLTGLPGNYFPAVVSFWDWLAPDKLVHLGMFGLLAFLMMYDRKEQYQAGQKRSVVIIVLLFGTFYGALTEILQHFVFVGRHGNVFDFFANMLGVAVGITFFGISRRKNRNLEAGL